jgi:hypothetical protein
MAAFTILPHLGNILSASADSTVKRKIDTHLVPSLSQ